MKFPLFPSVRTGDFPPRGKQGSCLPLRGNCGFALPVAGFRLRAAGGRKSVTGISAAAPLAGRRETGPGTANAARRSEAKPEFPQRKIPPAGEMSAKRTKGGRTKNVSKRMCAAFFGHRKAEVSRQAQRRRDERGSFLHSFIPSFLHSFIPLHSSYAPT